MRDISLSNDAYASIYNFDVMKTSDNYRSFTQNLYTPYDVHFRVGMTFQGLVVNSSGGSLDDARVRAYNSTGTLLFETYTSDGGVIAEQNLPLMELTSPAGYSYQYYTSGYPAGWDIYHFPIIVTINKSGYAELNVTILKDGYDKTEQYVREGFDQYFILSDPSNVSGGVSIFSSANGGKGDTLGMSIGIGGGVGMLCMFIPFNRRRKRR